MKRLCFLLPILLLLHVSQAAAAERILALSPHSCEMLYAIGAGEEVVGISEYCDYPDSFKDKPVIANYSRLFVEAALRRKPTLVIASNAALKGLKQLEKHGIRIFVTHPEKLEDIFYDLKRLGVETDHEREAAILVGRMQDRLQQVKKRIVKRQRVFFEVWSDPLMTEAGRSFITQVLHAAGGDNVFADEDVETMRLNVEAVVRAAPDIIVIPSKSGNIEARTLFWKQWLPNARLIAVNPDLISRPGPRIVDGIVALQQQVRP